MKQFLITVTDAITGHHEKHWFAEREEAQAAADKLVTPDPLVAITLIDTKRGHVHVSSFGSYNASAHQPEILRRLAIV